MVTCGQAGQTFNEINVTPLTDVFLVLLVVMLLTTSVGARTVLKVDPAECHCANQPKGTINAEVTAAGQVKINGRVIAGSDVIQITAAILQEQKKIGKNDIPLLLSSDADASQKYVVAVMDAAAGAGIKDLSLLPLKYH